MIGSIRTPFLLLRSVPILAGVLSLVSVPAAARGQEGVLPPPARAESVSPLSRGADAPTQINVVVGRGAVRVSEYAGSDVRYVVDGMQPQLLVSSADAGGVRLLGGDGVDSLRVWVPRGSSVFVESADVADDIDVVGATGAVEIVNESGHVNVSGAPTSLVVNTENGSITVRLSAWNGDGPYSVAIHNGSLYLHLPPNAGVDLDTRSLFRGSVVTDLPRERMDAPGDGGQRIRIHGGGPSLTVSMWNGSIHVYGD